LDSAEDSQKWQAWTLTCWELLVSFISSFLVSPSPFLFILWTHFDLFYYLFYFIDTFHDGVWGSLQGQIPVFGQNHLAVNKLLKRGFLYSTADEQLMFPSPIHERAFFMDRHQGPRGALKVSEFKDFLVECATHYLRIGMGTSRKGNGKWNFIGKVK
jgi:hypothetical protein